MSEEKHDPNESEEPIVDEGEDDITMLIENALSTQDRVLQVFPNMDALITQEETQSIEDLAAVLL